MKKFFFTLAFVFALFASSFANDIKVSGKVLAAFDNAFKKAQNVEWAQVNGMYHARFTLNYESYTAYFSTEGNLVVVARFIVADALPKGLQASLKEAAGNKVVAYIFELSDDEGVHYYAALQQGDEKEMLQSAGIKKWVAYDKVKL